MPLSLAAYLKRAAGPLFQVPTADGDAGEALVTDGDGNLSFAAPAPAAHNHDGAYQPLDAQLTDLALLSYAGNGNKVVRVNAGATAFELATLSAGASEIDINTQSGNYTQQASDLGDVIDFDTAAATLTLLAAATAGDKFYCWVRYRGVATGILTVDGNSSETIDGLATLTMYSGEVRLLICDGSNWTSVLVKGGYAEFTASGNFIVPCRERRARELNASAAEEEGAARGPPVMAGRAAAAVRGVYWMPPCRNWATPATRSQSLSPPKRALLQVRRRAMQAGARRWGPPASVMAALAGLQPADQIKRAGRAAELEASAVRIA
jgi:hypothetical protein